MHRRALIVLFFGACDGESCPISTTDPATGEEIPPPADPRFCDLGVTPGPGDWVIARSTTCETRACLRAPLEHELPTCGQYPEGTKGLCTATCTRDADCGGLEGPCVTGFTCQIAVTVGPYACERFCICKDFVDVMTTVPAPCE